MKLFARYFCIQSALIVFLNSANAQWIPVQTLEGGSVSDMAIDGNNIFALVENYGLVKSNDNGNNWSLIYNQDANFFQTNSKFSVDKGQIVLDAYQWKHSSDTGASWQVLNTPNNSIQDAVVIGGNIVIAGDSIYVSHDNGVSWTVTLGPIQIFYWHLIKSGNKLFVSDLFNAQSYVSLDSGATWNFFSNFGIDYDNVFTTKGDTVVRLMNQSITYTTDFGITWNVNPVPKFNIYPYEVLHFIDDSLFYINSDSVFWSLDLGLNWNYVSHKSSLFSSCMVKTDNSLLIGSSRFGIVKTDVSSGNMIKKNKNINAVSVRNFVAKGDTLIAVSKYGIIYFSQNNATTWNSYQFNGFVTAITFYRDTFYIGSYDQIFKSVNGGLSFDSLTTSNSNPSIYEMVVTDSIIYCATDYGVYAVSTLNGSSTKMGNLYSSLSITILDSTIYSITQQHVYKSSLIGPPIWIDISPPIYIGNNGWEHISSNDTAIYLSGRKKGVFRLYPPSTIWTNTGLHNKGPVKVVFNKNQEAFCSSSKGVVELRNYPGAKWDPINFGLPRPLSGYNAFAFNDSTIFMGSQYFPTLGLWKRSQSELAIVAGENEIVSEENDFIIYPNPVADFINLELPQNVIGHNISIEIYSEDGKQIINEQKTLSQQNNLQLNVSKLASGFYTVKIILGENQLNGSFVKIK